MFGAKKTIKAGIGWRGGPGLLFLGVWIFLWLAPWTTWLSNLPWLRLGLAMLIFGLPGLCFSIFLTGQRFGLLSHSVIGFSLSVFIVGALGLLGRIVHWPFSFIKTLFFVAGLIALLVMSFRTRLGQPVIKKETFSPTTLIVLAIVIAIGIPVAFGQRVQIDDFSYLAYLTNWQNAQFLNFAEVYHNTGILTEIRFWLAMHPMSNALLAEISGLHGLLLIGYYLGPGLVALAILATFIFYKELLESEQKGVMALSIQFTTLFLLLGNKQSGTMFFLRITEDKSFAAFILAPVFLLAVHEMVQSYTIRNSAFVLFTGWGLALTHPFILAYGIFIAGVYLGITTILRERKYRQFITSMIILAAIILPVASLRFVEVPWVSRNIFGLSGSLKQPGSYDLESALETRDILTRITYIKGTPFYGFNLDLVRINFGESGRNNLVTGFLSLSFMWILVASFLWSLFNLQRHKVAPLVMAASLLVLLCAIPYTGWIIGRVIGARYLYRAVWLAPVGLFFVVLLDECLNLLRSKWGNHRFVPSLPNASLGLVLVVSLMAISYFSVNHYPKVWNDLSKLPNYKRNLENLAALGEYIEDNAEQPSLFLAPNKLRDYLPGISSKSNVVIFRNSKISPDYPNASAVELSRVLSKKTEVTLEMRTAILRKYNIQYLLFQDDALMEYYAGFPYLFEIHEYGGYWIVKFMDVN